MQHYIQQFKDSVRKGDWVLLLLCLIASAFGCLCVASSTSYIDSYRYIILQIVATLIGLVMYALVSSVDADFFMEHRTWLVVFNIFFLSLLIPFGETVGGNRSWVDLPFLPFSIQVAEICKITYILIMASVMNAHKEKISSLKAVFHMVFHLGVLFLLNNELSGDMGVSLIFVFIFVIMAFSGGVNLLWFGAAIFGITLAIPFLWPRIDEYQRLRIEALFKPEVIDPTGTGVLWQTALAQRTLVGGGMTGQGLFNGHRTQNAPFTGQHTDFIFATIGEELGYVGCVLVLVLLALIAGRCIWVGIRSPEFSRRLICFGAAGALIFQTIINVGMCLGVMPVIGLTLPFISYGASSVVSIYAMLGLVSGVYARPMATSHERYIRPPMY